MKTSITAYSLALALLAMGLLTVAPPAAAESPVSCGTLYDDGFRTAEACMSPHGSDCHLWVDAYLGSRVDTTACLVPNLREAAPATTQAAGAVEECIDLPYGMDMGAGACVDSDRKLCQAYTYSYGPNHYEERCFGVLSAEKTTSAADACTGAGCFQGCEAAVMTSGPWALCTLGHQSYGWQGCIFAGPCETIVHCEAYAGYPAHCETGEGADVRECWGEMEWAEACAGTYGPDGCWTSLTVAGKRYVCAPGQIA